MATDKPFASPSSYELMLLGSELEFCRSSKLIHCKPESISKFSLDRTRQTTRYKLSASQIKKVMNADLWNSSRQALRFEVSIFLNTLAKQVGTQVVSYEQLVSRWKSLVIKQGNKYRKKKAGISGHSLLLSLNDYEHDMLFDFLEVVQIDSFDAPLKEQVVLEGTKSTDSIEFSKAIVEQASLINGNKTPNILLVTAGSRDSFRDIDAYESLFNQVGAKVDWLPVDRAINTLLAEQGSCDELERYRANFLNSYERQHIYPHRVATQRKYCEQPALITQRIQQADGVIFIGDSPKLLRNSLIINGDIVSDALASIKQRVASRQLFVAAIGNVSRAMVSHQHERSVITYGSSEDAMFRGAIKETASNEHCQRLRNCDAKGVSYFNGGLGLLDFSLIDTNFSTRGRFARLANVMQTEHTRFGLGIDRNTALLIKSENDKLIMKVMGSAGVTLLQNSAVDSEIKPHTLRDFKISYFTPEDQLLWQNDKLSVQYPSWKNEVSEFSNKPQQYKNLLFSNNFYHFARQACLIEDIQWSSFAGRKKQYSVTLKKDKNTNLAMGGLKDGDGFKLYCSYHALALDIIRR